MTIKAILYEISFNCALDSHTTNFKREKFILAVLTL